MAIAFDAASDSGTQTPGGSWSHTCTGSDRILFVTAILYGGAQTTSGATYNGVAMTEITTISISGGAGRQCMWYLVAPATGANNVVVNGSFTNFWACGASYTGASQTGQPDSYNSVEGTTDPQSLSTTVVASDCWLVGGAGNANSECSSIVTTRQLSTGNIAMIGDSNATVSTGSQSLTADFTGTFNHGFIVASFKPVGAAGPTNVKTINGITTANVKTINGIAIANVKSLNGIL